MNALEKKIRTSKNPDDRMERMLTYAKELQNSIGSLWYLTRFYSDYWRKFPFYSQYQTDLYDNAVKKFEYMKQKAFKIFTDAKGQPKLVMTGACIKLYTYFKQRYD